MVSVSDHPDDRQPSQRAGDTSEAFARPSRTTTAGPLPAAKRRGGGLLIWAAVLLAVAAVRWPMLKGSYYKVSGVEAPASAVAWRDDFDTAMAEASASGKPLLLDFSASWCPPCQVMKHDVWPDPGVGKVVSGRYVPVLVDVDDPRNAGVAERYEVSGIPAILVLDAEGRVLRRGGFMSPAQAMEFLDARPKSDETR